jgi:hypothetical protein
MNKPNYTKEENEFINKWACEEDRENDLNRVVFFPSTGKRVSTLDSVNSRKRALDRAEANKKKLANVD